MLRWILSQLGTNHSSGAERRLCNKFGGGVKYLIKLILNFNNKVFVCVSLIGVKSKYGSCSGNCTGFIKWLKILYTLYLYPAPLKI